MRWASCRLSLEGPFSGVSLTRIRLCRSRAVSYTHLDVYKRQTKVTGRPVTLRLNVNNVANRDYWLNSYYLGSPRSVALSAQMQF